MSVITIQQKGKTKLVQTTCPYCGVGCQLYLKVRNDRIVGVLPVTDAVNEGKLCIKGWTCHEFVHHPDRLTTPLKREDDGTFTPISWDEAYDIIIKKFMEYKEKYGPDSIAFFGSSKCTNEENYLLQKYARVVIGTNNIDNCARLCHAPTVTGLVYAFGSGAMTNSIAEVENADVIFVIGSNPTHQHPLYARRIIKAVLEKGAKLIVADPRAIDLAEFATIYLPHNPGSDIALVNGMMKVILDNNLEDREFIENFTENFEEFKESLNKYTLDYVSKITGVDAALIKEAALLFGKAESAAIVYAMGITQHIVGVSNVLSLANLAMLTGNIGKESTGVNPLRGHNNVQGACDVGALPDVLPGYQKYTDEKTVKFFEEKWKCTLPTKPGLTVTEIINQAGEQIKALYIMGENPMVSEPNLNKTEKKLKELDFLVVQDIFLTETAQIADIVLPGSSFAEKEGTFTNTERRVQLVRRAVPLPGKAKEDWIIIKELFERSGYKTSYRHIGDVLDEMAEVMPIYRGITYERVKKGEYIQWPCPNPTHPGTKFLHANGKFSRGKGRFSINHHLEPAERPNRKYPLVLTTGRILFEFHTRSLTKRSPTLQAHAPEPFVEINPDDAFRFHIKDGQKIKVESTRGEITIKAIVTDKIKPGIVFIPWHYAEAAANLLTIDALDPQAKIPEYKVCAVKITPL